MSPSPLRMPAPGVYTSPFGALSRVPSGNVVELVWSSPHVRAQPMKVVQVDPRSGESLTNLQVAALTRRYAAVLRDRYGIRRGDVVALFWPNSIWTRALHHAVLLLGAVVSPANVVYTASELAHQLRLTRAKLLLVDDALYTTALEAAAQAATNTPLVAASLVVRDLRALGDIVARHHPEVAAPEPVDGRTHPAYYCLSSGTSGLPKCVVTSHTAIAANVLQMTESQTLFGMPDGVVAACLPMSHIFGLSVYLWLSAYAAQRVVVFARWELEAVLAATVEHRISILAAVPPMILALAKAPDALLQRYPVHEHLRHVGSGAAPLAKSTARQLEERVPGVRIVQLYGMTETSPFTLATPLAGAFGDLARVYDAGSAGWLVPGAEARLVDPETGRDAAPARPRQGGAARAGSADGAADPLHGASAPGELWIRGPHLMTGYLDNAAATAEALTPDGWLRTGDVAQVTPEGQFFIVDRIKELIKSKGFQVAPAELEGLLLKDPDVADVAVIGVADAATASELPRAYLVLRAGADAHAVVRRFNASVAPYKRLWGGVVLLDAVPKSPSGKILRRLLRDRAKAETEAIVGAELASQAKL